MQDEEDGGSSAPGWYRATPGADPAPWAVRALFTRPRGDLELIPGSWAASVTVRPGGCTGSIASRWYSSGYRFVYVLPAWRCFFWNLGSRSPGVQDQAGFTVAQPVVVDGGTGAGPDA
ncbi:hypothetical protein [Streptomyces sp. NBC_01615]|uniref:hypothetical protein n=1 Tax=Streptomyces sp. NBC_01615 TaxID=2975898 RepID=UPI003862FC76